MKIMAPDPSLDDELQELYILSNHWIADIHFEEVEIGFLKKMINNYLMPGLKNDQINEMDDFNKTLTRQGENIAILKNKIAALLKFIGGLINESNAEIRIDLVEQFAALEAEMKTLFKSVKNIKKSLFSFTEEVMKTDCNAFADKITQPL